MATTGITVNEGIGAPAPSLAGRPLILLVAAFIAVPILFYLTFQRADQERQEMLLGSIQPLLPLANFDGRAFLAIIIDY